MVEIMSIMQISKAQMEDFTVSFRFDFLNACVLFRNHVKRLKIFRVVGRMEVGSQWHFGVETVVEFSTLWFQKLRKKMEKNSSHVCRGWKGCSRVT